jgi:hypothetical protein
MPIKSASCSTLKCLDLDKTKSSVKSVRRLLPLHKHFQKALKGQTVVSVTYYEAVVNS